MSELQEWGLRLLFCLICALLIALIMSVGGCALFQGGRVEARADYHVVAEDCSVSIVAVGYVKE